MRTKPPFRRSWWLPFLAVLAVTFSVAGTNTGVAATTSRASLVAVDTAPSPGHVGAVSLRSLSDPTSIPMPAYVSISGVYIDPIVSAIETEQTIGAAAPGSTAMVANEQSWSTLAAVMSPELPEDNGFAEVAPVPEPSTWIAAALAVLVVFYQFRRCVSARG